MKAIIGAVLVCAFVTPALAADAYYVVQDVKTKKCTIVDQKPTTTTETTPAAQGDPVAGKQVFLGSSACGGCHTLADAGSSGNVGPNLDDAKPTYDKVVTQVTNGGGVMPPFKGTLTEQQIADVAAYVSSVAGK